MRRCLATLLAVGLAACAGANDDPIDDADNVTGKADHLGTPESSAEASAILRLVGSPETDLARLDDDVRLNRRAAEAILAHRDGPDGQMGTRDDNPFESLAELAEVRFVGPYALEQLSRYAEEHESWFPVQELRGFVTTTWTSDFEFPESLEDPGGVCVFFLEADNGIRYGVIQDGYRFCLATAISEHPELTESGTRISNRHLGLVRDEEVLSKYQALDPDAFYLHLLSDEALETDGESFYCGVDFGANEGPVEEVYVSFAGRERSLVRGRMVAYDSDAAGFEELYFGVGEFDVPTDRWGTAYAPTSSIQRANGDVSFALASASNRADFALSGGAGLVVHIEHAGVTTTSSLSCRPHGG